MSDCYNTATPRLLPVYSATLTAGAPLPQGHMAFLRVLLISLAVAAVAATTDLPALPDFTSLPSSCGSVAQVQVGDTCESMA